MAGIFLKGNIHLAERRAEAYIRKLTYVRGDIFAVENTAVKDAVCAVADVIIPGKKEAGSRYGQV